MEHAKGERTYQNFINGKWSDPDSGDYYQVLSPGNYNESAGYFPLSNKTDVENAVKAAAEQFVEWKKKSPVQNGPNTSTALMNS